MGSERRRFPRVAFGQRGWFEAGSITLYAAVGNLSEGGLFVRTHAPLARGTRARVRLPLGADRELQATAEVVWESTQGHVGMGLSFVDLEDSDKERIRALLSRGVLEP